MASKPLLVSSDRKVIIRLDRPIMLMGRSAECDVVLDSTKVSRKHCCVAQVNEYLLVRDLGSTNGVRVNNRRVLESKLQRGDELTIADLRFVVEWDDGHEPIAHPRRRVDDRQDRDQGPILPVEEKRAAKNEPPTPPPDDPVFKLANEAPKAQAGAPPREETPPFFVPDHLRVMLDADSNP